MSEDPEIKDGKTYFEEWELDVFTIEIRLTDGLTTAAVEVWTIDEFDPPEHTDRFDYDTIGRIADAVTLETGDLQPAPFVVRETRSYTSWGASGAGQEIVFEIAQWALGVGAGGVAGAAMVARNELYDRLRSTVLSIVSEARDRQTWEREPMSCDEAVQRARWHVIRRFELETDEETFDRPSLELVGEEERDDGSRLVRFRDGDRRYEVELVDEYGLVRIGRIGWSE